MKIGALIHSVALENPGPSVPDGHGGYVNTWVPLEPHRVKASIKQASAQDLERQVSSTVQGTATHLVGMRYHPQVTLHTRLVLDDGAVLSVVNVDDINRRHVELVLACEEVVA